MSSLIPWSGIPGLQEAIKRENDVRDAAFLDEVTTNICGIAIRQMTPRDMIILDGLGNPLMSGAVPSPLQLADFLWRLSPQFRSNSRVRQFLFGWRCRRIRFDLAVKACWKYMRDTFQDSPGSSGDVAAMPYASWCAHLVHAIAISYGWSRSDVLNTPLKVLFQFLKCIRRHNDPTAAMFNPSDKVKGDYVRKLNADNLKRQRCRLLSVLKTRCERE